jgi:triosephosphate isomerase
MRKTIIAGNWKMYKTPTEAIELITLLKRNIGDMTDVEMVVCPPFPALSDVKDALNECRIALGAQNCYWEDCGAFTGEVAVPMLKSIGVTYVIIGHSERRQYFGETDETVNKKIQAVLKHGLTPIVCVGEVLAEREAGKTFDVVRSQCGGSFRGLSVDAMRQIVIAYEPVWAIGTGKTATPGQAQEVHRFIRDWLAQIYGEEVADGICIQYGGSVKPENTVDLMAQPDIDGALVGGASLNADSFSQIVKNACGMAA